ncbi:glycosyltransferase family 4 protein [Flavobacterium terrae]|uniref:Glycosyl transferases group 1 n=1 Tax=Flavobacterium terrae TaxID=415425 RepID=A0A1M6FRK5_9FLAO|nr:glycosyltransferase family 4 protein [Flavobacterium terrae]SHJ00341.1 Glycosyl transferases group 1 [Flavobacterium terrae]
MKKVIIHHRSSHHSEYSGYAKLINYIDDAEVISGENSILSERLARFVKRYCPQNFGGYDSVSAKKNEELLRKFLFSRNKNILIHYLNGERDIRQAINFLPKKIVNIATFHKTPTVLATEFNNLKYFQKLDGAIAVGINQVDFLKKWLNTENVVYIPHGVDTDFFVPDYSKRKEKSLLFVGQHLRDFEVLNYTIPFLVDKVHNLEINVVLKQKFQKKIIEHKSVNIFSGVDDITLREMYQKASLLFLPLTDVTACNSILEAMACGLPIVTTDLEGNRGYGLNEYNSFLVPKNDYSALLDTTLYAINKDTAHMAIETRENALKFSWNKIGLEVNKFYEQLKR